MKLPLKLLCFTWLLTMDRVLTWDHLQSRGFYGPSRCVFCKNALEDCGHLFMLCPFTKKILQHFSTSLGFPLPIHSSVLSFLSHWINSTSLNATFRFTPVVVFWFIWLLRNRCIFDNDKPVASLVISNIESCLAFHPVPQLKIPVRQIGPKPVHTFPVGYFDGAAQLHMGGAGFVIFISDTHFLCFSVGCGNSTNTRAELLALWSVLRVSLLMGLPLQLVLGDSMVIITWVKRLATLEIPSLKHWCDEIFSMLHTVPPVTFDHIFREHNKLADSL